MQPRKLSAGLLIAVSLTGCTAAPVATGAQPEDLLIGAPVADPNARAQALEFVTPDETAELAVKHLVEDCMAKEGFDYHYTIAKPADPYMAMGTPKLDPDDALTVGYGLQGRMAKAADMAALERESAVPGFGEALSGDGAFQAVEFAGMSDEVIASGCLAEGPRKVYGSVRDGYIAATMASKTVLRATRAAAYDSEMADAEAEWAECMSTSSFPQLETPAQAYAMAEQHLDQEFQIAAADTACRESTDWQTKVNAVLDRYLTALFSEIEPLVAEVIEIRQAAAARGRAILGA